MQFVLRDIPTRKALLELSGKIKEVDVSSVETMLTFLRTASEVQHAIYDKLEEHGLSRGKFTVLLIIYQDGENGIYPSEIAEKAEVSRATVTGLLDRLERDGIVERRTDEYDGRMSNVRLTKKGIAMLEAILPAHFLRVSKLMSHLSEQERNQLVDLLEKVRAGAVSAQEG